MIIILLTLFAAFAAWAGGQVAIRSRHKLQLVMAVTSGLVLGLVAFDLLPEIFEGAQNSGLDTIWPMVLFVAGFVGFHAVEKFVVMHGNDEDTYKPHHHPSLGIARALALAGHSFMDGLSIGVAFQVNPTVGYAVALAVIGHRFADGFDTTAFMIFHKNTMPRIRQLLLVVVVMPVLGGLVSLVVHLSDMVLTLYLGFFAGVLMYIAVNNILPQAHTKDRSPNSLWLLLVGAIFMFVVTRFV